MGRVYFTAAILCALGSVASAYCMAEFKAKKDDPLRLDYGEMMVQAHDCTVENAEAAVGDLLEENGWTLLRVLSVHRHNRQ